MSATQGQLLGLPRGRALTRDDLDKMPDDGHRYELIDGVLVVSPAPILRHQAITTWRLVDGVYVESGTATGSDVLRLAQPFAVEIEPAALIAD